MRVLLVLLAAFGLWSASLVRSAMAQEQPLPCWSYAGVQVPYIPDQTLNNVGIATFDGFGRPIIIMNPYVLAQFSPLTQQFWFAHECAHHALMPQLNSEVAADCWAVRALRQIGWMTNRQHVEQLLYEISTLPGSIPTGHLPGPHRAANLFACLST